MSDHAVSSVRDALKWLGLGTVGAVVVLELGLRALEPLFSRRSAPDADFVVLCEGDSFTYGIGGRSFPDQIEVVAAERGARPVAAINEGIPGLTTAMVADRLEEHILATDPDYVVVLIGENNSWNSVNAEAGIGRHVELWMLKSRVYKFYKVVTIGWRHNTFHEAAGTGTERPKQEVPESPENIGLLLDGEQSPEVRSPPAPDPAELPRFMEVVGMQEAGRYDEALVAAEAFIGRNPTQPSGYLLKVATLLRLGRYEEAFVAAQAGLQQPKDPFHEELYFQGGHARKRLNDIEGARAQWRDGLRAFPTSRALYWSIARSYFDAQHTFDVLADVESIPGIDGNTMHQALLALREQHGGDDLNDDVSRAFEADIDRMIAIAAAHDVPILFSSYPDAIYPEVERAARRGDVPFIDLRPAFKQRFKSREEYISPDRCHCNTAGYRLMAELFVDQIAADVPSIKP